MGLSNDPRDPCTHPLVRSLLRMWVDPRVFPFPSSLAQSLTTTRSASGAKSMLEQSLQHVSLPSIGSLDSETAWTSVGHFLRIEQWAFSRCRKWRPQRRAFAKIATTCSSRHAIVLPWLEDSFVYITSTAAGYHYCSILTSQSNISITPPTR